MIYNYAEPRDKGKILNLFPIIREYLFKSQKPQDEKMKIKIITALAHRLAFL